MNKTINHQEIIKEMAKIILNPPSYSVTRTNGMIFIKKENNQHKKS
jgi:hypothetical protein